VTFKDLQKAIQSQAEQIAATGNLDAKLQGKPFWIFDKEQHRSLDIDTKGHCCFWHVIGLPQKDSHDMPLLGYQKILYDSLQNYKHIWILKSRGIGVTEFLLRYVAWCCASGELATNSRVCVVTGPRLNIRLAQVSRWSINKEKKDIQGIEMPFKVLKVGLPWTGGEEKNLKTSLMNLRES
jgi:hypothetical protein